MSKIMPAIFLGHGNPMNALSNNSYTEAWSRIGNELPRPAAIVSVSAHWFVSKTAVTSAERPRTIHDFGGFPRELYEVQYPAPGDAKLAGRIQELLARLPVEMDESWGLDHGTWSVLRHVYPGADIPVVQLSIDQRKPPSFHFDLGRKLAPLRKENILIIGSGNIVHNLRLYAWEQQNPVPYDWAARFEATVRHALVSDDYTSLVNYETLGSDAAYSIPTPDHYLPLIYVIATARHGDAVTFPVEGFDGGSISMLAVKVG